MLEVKLMVAIKTVAYHYHQMWCCGWILGNINLAEATTTRLWLHPVDIEAFDIGVSWREH